jgi:hypothetical protein
MNAGARACYLYCLTPACGLGALAEAGVDERIPVLRRELAGKGAGIAAVFSEVEVEEFVGPAAEARFEDLAWLGPRVCRHEAVIEEAMRRGPVLPARFATLFTSLESLERYVVEHRKAIAAFFTRIGNRQEWALRGVLDRTEALKALSRPTIGQVTPESAPGAHYFEQKRIKTQAEREFGERLKEFCRQAAAALGATRDSFRERKPRTLEEGGGEMVLNWAFLLAPTEMERFRVTLDRLNGEEAFAGLRLVLAGPWPPFSFTPDLSADAPE